MTAVTSARVGDRTGDDDYYESVNTADWIAIVAAVIGFGSAVVAVVQVQNARTQAGAAERSAQAAESSAAIAQESLSVHVDYTPVLLKPKSTIDAETSYRILEIRWKGPRVELDRLVATKWLSVDYSGDPNLDQFSAVDVELHPADGKELPHTISNGETLLFDWPGAQPGPGGFAAEVRAEYKLGGAGVTLKRLVEVYGYGGFSG